MGERVGEEIERGSQMLWARGLEGGGGGGGEG